MHDLTVVLTVEQLTEVLVPAGEIAARYYGDAPHGLADTRASRASARSGWNVRCRFTGDGPEQSPAGPSHTLEFKLHGFVLSDQLERAGQFASRFYGDVEHVLVDSHATERGSKAGSFTTSFTYLGMPT